MFFVLKSVIAAVLVIAVLQIKVGSGTLENHAERWVRTSEASMQLRHVASGAIKVSEDIWKRALGWAESKPKKSSSNRAWNVEFKRKIVEDESEN